jgi:hypothetical protein
MINTHYECQTITEVFWDADRGGNNRFIKIGDGFYGVVRKVKIYDFPKIEDDLKWMRRTDVNCIPFNGVSCVTCDVEELTNDWEFHDWDFRSKCFSICAED